MEYVIIAFVALVASALTFFSGFGLGTILTPVFLFFFPVEIAIALTGVVHLLNNFFKLTLIGGHIDIPIALKFGLSGVVGAFLGANLLFLLSNTPAEIDFIFLGRHFETEIIKIVIGCLLLIFAIIEVLPFISEFTFPQYFTIPGGLLSGFFGGLSGHQGALRSAFLIRFGLSKETFIATGIAIACFIDLTRLGIYWQNLRDIELKENSTLLFVALGAAFIGAIAGKLLLKKITLTFVHIVVAVLISAIGILLGLGLI